MNTDKSLLAPRTRAAGAALFGAIALFCLEAGAAPYSYTLTSAQLSHLFPNAADTTLPSFYANQPGFPQQLGDAITLYTKQSLTNDGIAFSDVTVTVDGDSATVNITGDAAAATYGEVMKGFVAAAAVGWNAAQSCVNTSGCWGNPIAGGEPWAFFAPLGLPLVNQQAVTFLDYPPNDSLCTANYLANFTTARWNAVLTTAGIANPVLTEAIVDAHPIAAPGSHQGDAIDATTRYFAGANGYDNTLLGVLVNPPGGTSARNTRPVVILGTPARTVWGELIGYTGTKGTATTAVPVNSAGSATLPGQAKATGWVAGNHPDVTTYQCCPGDTSSQCSGSTSLVPDEIIDLTVACTLKAMMNDPDIDPTTAQQNCSSHWNATAQQGAVCVRARMDYNFTAYGMPCKCELAAQQFCADNANNACATAKGSSAPLSCSSYDSLCDGSSPAATPPNYHYPGCAKSEQGTPL